MSKRFIPGTLALLMLALFAVTLPVAAQGEIIYDEPVTGELTADVSAVEYTFSGAAGDVLFFIYQPVDILGDLDRPKLVVTAPNGRELLAIDAFGAMEGAAWLPEDGLYTVTATRVDETSVGEFSLAVHLVPELVSGKTYTTAIDNDGISFYYAMGGQPFILHYTKLSGDFYPSLSANVIRDGDYNPGALDYMAQLQGSEVEQGMLYVNGQSELYIITLAEALFDITFGTVEGEYSLMLELAEE